VFRDLRRDTFELEDEPGVAMGDVPNESRFIGGETVVEFEREFA
jgi:hypothetical protein